MKWTDWVFGYDEKNSHGSSAFGGFWEERSLLSPRHDGIYLGGANRLTAERSFQHLLLQSPTGAGKTTRFILNNALRRWQNPVGLVFFDPSGEICRLSESWLISQGFHPIKIDLTNPDQSDKFNPLLLVTDRSSARMVAQSLMSVVYDKNQGETFWTESAISVLKLLCLAVSQGLSESDRTLNQVFQLLNKLGHKQDEVDRLMQTVLGDEDFDEYCSFVGSPDKLKQSVIATCKSALFLYSDDLLKKICGKSTFSFAELRERKTVLFLIQEEHKIPYFKSVWAVFFRQCFEYLMSHDGNPVYFFMDEMAQYTIPDFDSIIATIRKRKVALCSIIQSYEQFQANYGLEKARTIFENCTTKVYLPGLSFQSAQLVSQTLGMKTETYSSKGIFESNTQPLHRTSRQLLTPDEIRTMHKNEALVIHGNFKPLKIKLPAWYKSRTLTKRSRLS